MNEAYRNMVANYGGTQVTHIGLIDDEGDELTGGEEGSEYARKAVTWENADDGLIRPNADLTFNVPAGNTVAGWRGYSADELGTDYGGAELTPKEFTEAGQYVLEEEHTAIKHDEPEEAS